MQRHSTPIVLSEKDIERFWSKVDRSGGPDACWEWQAYRNFGYGSFCLQSCKPALAKSHRVSWVIANGQIPDGLSVCHHCDNPGCVNPNHLFLGTHKDNARDMREKGRSAKGERNGMRKHPERNRLRLYPEQIARGEQNPASRLTESQVIEARRQMANGVPMNEVARRFGMARRTICQIRYAYTWRHLLTPDELAECEMARPKDRPRGERNHAAKVTADQVREIRRLYKQGMTQTQIGERFGLNQAYVSAVIRRKTWAHITDEEVPA